MSPLRHQDFVLAMVGIVALLLVLILYRVVWR